MSESNHHQFYRWAKAYEVAFSFREVARECDFMLDQYKSRRRRRTGSFLELAGSL